jgi:hypothetical protein
MSATTTQSDADETPSKQSASRSKTDRLRSYLREQVQQDGELYFKSKFIADEVGLSAKEIGALMVKLQESPTAFEIEKWSYTSATTWRIEAPA